MNFLKALGQHVSGSGLSEAWIEAGLLGPNLTEYAMSGKAYNKAIRCHKLTFQAMWRLLLPELLSFLDAHEPELKDRIVSEVEGTNDHNLISILKSARFGKFKSNI